MTIAEAFAAAAAHVFAALGRPAVYRAADTDAGDAVTACKEEMGVERIQHGDRRDAVVKLLRSEVVTLPTRDATIVLDGVTWRVERLLGSADGTSEWVWALLCWTDRTMAIGGGARS